MGKNPEEDYRAQAALCREMAANARTEEAAAEFMTIANLWLGLASAGSIPAEPGFQARSDSVQQAAISPSR